MQRLEEKSSASVGDRSGFICTYKYYGVGFEVLTAVSTKLAVFWVVAPCSLVEIYQRFRGPCCDDRLDDGGIKDL
jgi:hypothetical protein